MYLADAEHLDRFDEMKHDLNSRESEWWLYRSDAARVISEDLQHITTMLRDEMMVVGPFGATFVKQSRSTFKRDLYGIPLQHVFVEENENTFEGIAYVATNDMHSVLLKSVFDYLRDEGGHSDFINLNLTAICIQTAWTSENEPVVVGAECFEALRPLAYYEHPINGRLLMSMGGNEVPEHSAFVFSGKRRTTTAPLGRALMEINSLYQEYELNNISTDELKLKLYSYFEGQK